MDENNIERGFKRKMTPKQWAKLILASCGYLAWVIWMQSPIWLILLPFIIDIYYTKFIPWTGWKKSKNKTFKAVMSWVDAIGFALIAVYFINTFFFQNYQIPTSSLEKTLLVGDYLFVSKMSYGPRVPMTPLSFPLAQHTMPITGTKSYIDNPQYPYRRLKGFGHVERNQIVVFNFPAGDSVALNMQNPDYYTLAHYNGGKRAILNNPAIYGEVVHRPVDRRENYVKRCVGMPGDSLSIVANQVYIDGEPLKNPKEMQLSYYVETNGTKFGPKNWEDLQVSVEDRAYEDGKQQIPLGNGQHISFLEYIGFTPNDNGSFNPVYRMPLTEAMLKKARSMSIVTKIIPEPGFMGGACYPLGYDDSWTRANYGPIWIPEAGATIELNDKNYAFYERCIRNYENNTLEVKNGKYFINGKEATDYTFKLNYYWMMGDNRDNSADSRSWGFVPEDHIVGRPLFVWLSIDKDKPWFGGRIRFDRLFLNVKDM